MDRTACNIRKKHDCELSLSELAEFVDQETTLVNNSMFSREALECYSGKLEKCYNIKYKKVKSIAIETMIGDYPLKSECTEDCDEFKGLPVNRESNVFFRKKLCYGWCLIIDGYDSKTCTKRRKCREYDRKHPPILHGVGVKRNRAISRSFLIPVFGHPNSYDQKIKS